MDITRLKVGDRVAWHEFGMSFHGTVSEVRRQSHFGEDRIDVDVDQDDGSVWSFNDDHPGTLRLVETPDPVHTPAHYQHPSGIEVIEITRHESFLRGNVLKYVLRAPYKGNELEDLKKAAKYLAWELERLEKQSDV